MKVKSAGRPLFLATGNLVDVVYQQNLSSDCSRISLSSSEANFLCQRNFHFIFLVVVVEIILLLNYSRCFLTYLYDFCLQKSFYFSSILKHVVRCVQRRHFMLQLKCLQRMCKAQWFFFLVIRNREKENTKKKCYV